MSGLYREILREHRGARLRRLQRAHLAVRRPEADPDGPPHRGGPAVSAAGPMWWCAAAAWRGRGGVRGGRRGARGDARRAAALPRRAGVQLHRRRERARGRQRAARLPRLLHRLHRAAAAARHPRRDDPPATPRCARAGPGRAARSPARGAPARAAPPRPVVRRLSPSGARARRRRPCARCSALARSASGPPTRLDDHSVRRLAGRARPGARGRSRVSGT